MHSNYAECKKRASLVPAAAVIPALRAYIKVVAFKTPVVEIAVRRRSSGARRAGWGVVARGGRGGEGRGVCEGGAAWVRGCVCGGVSE